MMACTGRVNKGIVWTSKYNSSATAFQSLAASAECVVPNALFLFAVIVSVTASRKKRSGLK